MTSREFNQHTSSAKQAANNGPVFITDRGERAYVLMTNEEYERLTKKKPFVSLYDALVDPNATGDDFNLMDFIPKREVEPIRSPFPDDE
ncbi:MAG: type II toxin-antitoxin system prevent-host-death family antitoxin [Devosia sp.]|nr:type II toxin-antitoxin system prevent-host-death family antitoxin [Devosia sp.]